VTPHEHTLTCVTTVGGMLMCSVTGKIMIPPKPSREVKAEAIARGRAEAGYCSVPRCPYFVGLRRHHPPLPHERHLCTVHKVLGKPLPPNVTREMVLAYCAYDEISRKYASNKGYYDRSRSDNIKLGKRWKKFQELIDHSGQAPNKIIPQITSLVLAER
jgi:hypothetical protein